jgi:hypothetical protein
VQVYPEVGDILFIEKQINGAVTTSLKSVVNLVRCPQGRIECRNPAAAGGKPNREMAIISK